MAFKRVIELTIGPPGELGKKIKDLRINFSIEKTDTESQNIANIKIYNLSKETSSEVGKVNNKVILRAGYEDETGISNLFFGDIKSAIDRKEGVARILEINAYDGYANVQNKNISISFSAGTPVQQVFDNIVDVFGLPLTNPIVNLSGQYVNGYSFVGKAKDALTEVLKRVNKDWTIQNQQLVILSPGETIERTGLLLSSDTGLIDQPEALNDSDENQLETDDVPKRWRIKSLLYPQLLPGAEIQVRSNIVNGIFRVETANFEGDNFEGDFIAEIEVIAV